MTQDALASRLEELHPDGFGWALACCDRDPEMAQEVLQLTYLKILTGKARYDGRANLKTWLFAVIRNTAREQRRRAWLAAGRIARFRSERPDPPPQPDPESRASVSQSARIVVEALSKLSRRQREVLHLVFYQGMTIDDAAGVMGLSPGTARIHYERGKSRLRRLLPTEVRP